MIAALLSSCSHSRLESVLSASENNRAELEKVLQYYSKQEDMEKYAAAE